ncbi:DUF3047 family protein [Herminiimonas fonticola]|uniref:DUF3047 family protein n=2 Tax=Herminiimonas fonticola TaxID=303380 RepID=A0A4R6G318_9BURK|nr:Protein of unknown function (DUF3047) [Herminiimonas fonticola]TDN88841.1 DUF3047 family protein [Herminiimonas fonticola]
MLFSIAACTHTPKSTDAMATYPSDDVSGIDDDEEIAAFSQNQTDVLSAEWEPMLINRNKKRTEYTVVSDQGRKVLHARAAASASGLMQKLDIDPFLDSRLTWEWRISRLVESADNHDRAREDAPARVILGFDGNKDNLPFADQIMFEAARAITGREIPYATLMYIRARKAPVDTVISNSRSGRVKMIVVATGKDGVGEWRAFSRDIAADYERAFGEKPGRLIAVGVLTDTDNTGETVEAWYRDIQLTPNAPIPVPETAR